LPRDVGTSFGPSGGNAPLPPPCSATGSDIERGQ